MSFLTGKTSQYLSFNEKEGYYHEYFIYLCTLKQQRNVQEN